MKDKNDAKSNQKKPYTIFPSIDSDSTQKITPENITQEIISPEKFTPVKIKSVQGFARIPYFLLVGSLSMFMVEVGSGSSSLWFIDLWSLLVTFPLYLSHLLFFLNVAHRTKRTSVAQLYLFGCLFGLYESWITKVLWTGFSGDSGPIFGTFLGLASLEFLILVFWSHPVCAFVLPVLTYEAFALHSSDPNTVIAGHRIVLTKNKARSRFLIVLPILWSLSLGYNSYQSPFNAFLPAPLVAAISVAGSAILIFFLLKRCEKKPENFSVNALILEKRGFRILTVYFIGFNLFWGVMLNPGNIPKDPIGIYAVIAAYGIFIALLWKSPKQSVPSEKELPTIQASEIYDKSDFKRVALIFGIVASILAISQAIGLIMMIAALLVLPFVAAIIFIWVVVRRLYAMPLCFGLI